MNTKQGDLLNTQGNAENNPKQNLPLIERQHIEGTPFTLIKQDNKCFITMGDYRITENHKTKVEAFKWIEKNKWFVITNICTIIIEKLSIQNETYKKWKEENIKNEQQPNYETESL